MKKVKQRKKGYQLVLSDAQDVEGQSRGNEKVRRKGDAYPLAYKGEIVRKYHSSRVQKTWQIVGTGYRPNRSDLDSLKSEVADKTTNRITFIEIYELLLPEGRVIMFQIPAAPQGIPIAWEGHYYGRDGESIGALNLQEFEQIRNQGTQYDWSAQICEGATIDDLDPSAITKARQNYREKLPEKAPEVDSWDDSIFLNKAKITVQDRITRTALSC